jgi:hypothetical protein
MYSAWTKHLKEEKDKESFRHRVLSAKEVLRRLDQIIEEQETELTDSSSSMSA